MHSYTRVYDFFFKARVISHEKLWLNTLEYCRFPLQLLRNVYSKQEVNSQTSWDNVQRRFYHAVDPSINRIDAVCDHSTGSGTGWRL